MVRGRADLEVRPGGLQGGLLLVGVVVLLVAPLARRQRAEQVGVQHEHDVLAHRLRELAGAGVYVVHQLQKRLPLHLLLPHVLRLRPERFGRTRTPEQGV